MPLYSYKCTKCNFEIEMQREIIHRDTKAYCSECKKGIIKRLVGFPTANQFKGKGWTPKFFK